MSLTVIVTRDVAYRYRGFLASIMLEIAPGVYIAPQLNAGVRSRAWQVMHSWYQSEPSGSIVMVWRAANQIGGVGIEMLGEPPKELIELDGIWVTRKILQNDL